MRYPKEHWEQIAKRYMSEYQAVKPADLVGGKTEETVVISRIQNHYPHVTTGTVAEWIRRCRRDGLI